MIYNGLLFKNRKFDFCKLQEFGFALLNTEYVYKTNILDSSFVLTVKIKFDETVDIKLTEALTGDDYNLIFVKAAEGEFVGKVKEAVENVLVKVKDKCTYFSAFRSEYANLIIKYIEQKYGDKPEFLWEKFPNTCIFRRNDKKGRWYAALLTVAKHKIGLDGQDIIEIVDLKAKPETIEQIVDNKKYFQGYHMNKKHWFTICLEGTDEPVEFEEIKKRIDDSYKLL